MLGTTIPQTANRAPHSRAARTSRTAVQPKASLFMPGATGRTDATADLLSNAIKWALQTRLRTYKDIKVSVESNAMDLMGGKFGGMTVTGTHWRTPKQLTAAAIRVSVGEMLVDQQALLFQQRVALKNIPIGSCTLTLTPADLGNFMTHDLMKAPAGKAIKGQPFTFHQETVSYARTGAATGQVLYEGTTHVAGQPHTFEVAMEAEVTPHTPRANSHSHASHHHHSHTRHTSHGHRGSAPPPLRITAKRTRHRARAHHNAHHNAHANGHKAHTHAHGNSAAATQQPQAAALATAVATAETDAAHEVHDPTLEKLVGDELSRLFNSLTLDLQGVELSGPRLRLLDAGAAGQGASGEGALGAPELLEIHGTLRLVSIPPLNMQF